MIGEKAFEIVRQRSGELQRFPGDGVAERKIRRVERRSGEHIVRRAVESVAKERVADGRHVYADLVRAPRERADAQQRARGKALQNRILRARRLPCLLYTSSDGKADSGAVLVPCERDCERRYHKCRFHSQRQAENAADHGNVHIRSPTLGKNLPQLRNVPLARRDHDDGIARL